MTDLASDAGWWFRCALLVTSICAAALDGSEVVKYRGDGGDLQQIVDQAAEYSVVECDESKVLTFEKPLVLRKPLTLSRLRAQLPAKLSRTSLIEVKSEGVTLLDLELHGNYDSVTQDERKTLVWLARGNFRVERCRFFDGSKDGLMITPEPGKGDLIGGVIRDIEAHRMGRDAVSISGGNQGSRVKNVTVENVLMKTSYLRGAVEVSDGTDNIVVRNVRSSDSLYAIDIQDHKGESAPNINVLVENVEAIDCTHAVRTANSPRGHTNLVLRNMVATHCKRPFTISNTENVVIENVRVEQQSAESNSPPIALRNCHGVSIRKLEVVDRNHAVDDVQMQKCTRVNWEEMGPTKD